MNRNSGQWTLPGLVALCISIAAGPAPGILPPSRPRLANYDRRAAVAGETIGPSLPQRLAAAELQRQVAGARVDWDAGLASPGFVGSAQRFLSGEGGEGGGISREAAAAVPRADRHRAIKGFLNQHAAVFGHNSAALDQARIAREFVDARSGLRTVVWQQRHDNLPIFEAVLIGHISRKGELVSVGSRFVPEPGAAADRGTPERAAQRAAPSISARQAIVNAARAIEEDIAPGQIVQLPADQPDPEQPLRYAAAPGLAGEIRARLVWLPLNRARLRLCWEIVLTSRGRGEMFRVLVDATSGEALLRQGLTHYLSESTFRVYSGDSPSPFSPGHPIPRTNQPPVVPRALIRTAALNTNASPAGWINDFDNQTIGNNVDAHLDRDDNDQPDLPRPQGAPGRVFDFPLDLTREPSTYGEASVVQLFYWCNWMHDKLYELGFTEAAGNFQVNNFGRGGLGNDPLLADAQDGGGFDNANMSTPPDGLSPRMQMYLFSSPEPQRDGSLDAEIVLHEYTHGLSDRRVGGGVGITELQSAGMGEGWSDFYALSLLSEPTDDVGGTYAAGAYASFLLNGLNENYYFGIRRYPYSTDLGKNPLTFKDIDPGQASDHPGVPRNPATGSSFAAEVHAQGEVWCVTLWEARANLILKHGFEVGNQLILQLVTDGMNLSPANPNFVQARDAILQADLVNNAGANQKELWRAFAKRGLGENATSPPSSTTIGVEEDFSTPDSIRVSPFEPMVVSGPAGGPFQPSSWSYLLSNVSTGTVTWSGTNPSPWMSLSNIGGALMTNAPATLVSATLEPLASLLPPGLYTNRLAFLNRSSGQVHARNVLLRIDQPDWFTQVFGRATNALSFQTITFTPDDSPAFYSVCRQSADRFPTDPQDGEILALGDDEFVTITLAKTTPVSLYGFRTNVFHIGGNGYVTLETGDRNFMPSGAAHFRLPRISALFDDLSPQSGEVSWKQFEDRVAITFLNVPEYGTENGNSFQIEWLFSGVIRITWLNIDARGGVAGLSRGSGLPAGFSSSNFRSYPECGTRALSLVLPPAASERAGLLPARGEIRLPDPASSNLTIKLVSSDRSELTVPASATVVAGATNAFFDLTLHDDGLPDGTQRPSVTASAPGYLPASASMLVSDSQHASLKVRLPSRVSEGASSLRGLITLSPAPSEPILVNLSSSDPSELQVPAYVIIPAMTAANPVRRSGEEEEDRDSRGDETGTRPEDSHEREHQSTAPEVSVAFEASVMDDHEIDGARRVRVQARVEPWRAHSAFVTVLDDEDTSLRVEARPRLGEAAGEIPAAGVVRISGTLRTNLVVLMASSDPLRLEVQGPVTIQAGQTEAPFGLIAINNGVADGARLITLTAQSPGWRQGSAVISLADDETPVEPTLPSPPHLSTNVSPNLALSWSSGSGELVANGGFETGDLSGWRQEIVGSGRFVINDGTVEPPGGDVAVLPLNGNYSALSIQTGAGRHSLYQDIQIPATATSAILSWSDQIRNHAGQFTGDQAFRVEVRSLSNVVRQVLFTTRPGDPLTNGWVRRTYDLGRYIGQSIRLAFVEEDGLYYLNVHLDAVSLDAGPASAQGYDIFFGTEPNPGAAQFQGTTRDTIWPLPRLDLDTSYYWKVIARGAQADTAGPIWTFRTRGIGPLHHFLWDNIATVQYLDRPFPVAITARDDIDNLITNFTGQVDLSGAVPSPPGTLLTSGAARSGPAALGAGAERTVAITPLRSDPFTNGSWHGRVAVLETAGNMRLTARDDGGHAGIGNAFSVVTAGDLAVEVTTAPNPVSIGGTQAWTITITNTGPDDATGVALSDTLPPELTLISARASRGSCASTNGGIRCDLGTIPGGTLATVELLLRPRALGLISNTVTVARGEPDAVLSNNTATAVALVQTPTLSIEDASRAEGNSGVSEATFTVRLVPASPEIVSVRFATGDGPSNNAAVGSDYFPTNGLLVFQPGETTRSVGVRIAGDGLYELDELFAVRLSAPANAALGKSAAIGRILNDDPLPTLSIAPASVAEGNAGITNAAFRLRLSAASSQAVEVFWLTIDGTAIATNDYQDVLFDRIVFSPGQTNRTINVAVRGDTLNEPDETFLVLCLADGADTPEPFAVGTIVNDDLLPSIVAGGTALIQESCANGVLDPGETVTMELTLRNSSTGDAVPEALVAALQTEGGIVDLSGAQAYGRIPRAGAVSRPFTFKANGACGGTVTAVLRLRDGTNDLGSARFPIELGHPRITFLENFDGLTPPALPPGWSSSRIGAGTNWATVASSSPSRPNSVFAPDPDRLSDIQLTSPSIRIATAQARLAFDHRFDLEECCDGGSLQIAIGSGPFLEILDAGGRFLGQGYTGDRSWGGTSHGFVHTLVALPPAAAGQTVQFRWRLQSDSSVGGEGWYVDNVSVQDGSDCCYTDDLSVRVQALPELAAPGAMVTYRIVVTNTGPSLATSISLTNVLPLPSTFGSVSTSQGVCSNVNKRVLCSLGSLPAAAQAEVTITAVVAGLGPITDLVQITRGEPDADLSNNSATAVVTVSNPTITFEDVSVVEGDAGSTNAVFTLRLSPPSTNTVAFSFTTFDNFGGAGTDYVATNGVIAFAPGETERKLAIAVLGDLANEPDEPFFIRLSGAVNADLGRTLGIFLVIDDDPVPVVSLADAVLVEGDRGTNRALFRISLSNPGGSDIKVNYTTRDGTATGVEDYLPATGLFTFRPGQTNGEIAVSVRGDLVIEPDETFSVSISNPVDAVLGRAQAIGRIVNDDGLPGRLHHFAWAAIASPQYVNQPFAAQLTARDGLEQIAAGYAGNVPLTASRPGEFRTNDLLGNITHQSSASGIALTLGYAFTPNKTLIATHFRHYFGQGVSIWSEQGALLASKAVTSAPGTWLETALDTPVQLEAGARYRIAAHTSATGSYFLARAADANFQDGTIDQGFSTSGQGFPNGPSSLLWMVSLRYTNGTIRPLPLEPVQTAAVTAGHWTDNLTLGEAGARVTLVAMDSDGHVGESNPFDVLVADDVSLGVSASPEQALTNSPVTWQVTVFNPGPGSSSKVRLTTRIPAEFLLLSSSSSQGACAHRGDEIICELGSIPPLGRATVSWIANTPPSPGDFTNLTTLSSGEPDPNQENNLARSVISVRAPSLPPGLGTGLVGEYFDNENFTGTTVTRIDPLMALDFGQSAPAPGISPFPFSARWSGSIQPRVTGPFTLHVVSAEGVRIWLNDQRILDNWTSHLAQEDRVSLNLSAGEFYPVFIELYERRSPGMLSLTWSPPDLPKELIPTTQLHPLARPMILVQPVPQPVRQGTAAGFSVLAVGSAPLRYQWRLAGTALPGATGTNLVVSEASLSDVGDYSVVVSNSYGSVTSSPAALTLALPPTITFGPQSQTITVGAAVTFTVGVSGSPPFGYLWRSGGRTIAAFGLGGPSLTITNVQLTNAGNYSVIVTNAANLTGVLSPPAVLTVLADRDGDRMPDSWELAYGLDPGDPSDAAADKDGDGLTNLQEYVAGTNPTNAASALRLQILKGGSGSAVLRFTSLSNLGYTIDYSLALDPPEWRRFTNIPPRAGTNAVELLDPDAGGSQRKFYRLTIPGTP